MKLAYLNCSSGIAGDMLLAAFIGAGVPARTLAAVLRKGLGIREIGLEVVDIERRHLPAKLLTVRGDRRFDSPAEMRGVIRRARLSPNVRAASLAILGRLVKAEARVHGIDERKVHFHELNSLDTLVDIVGACLCVELLAIESIIASPVNVGSPAPAAAEIISTYRVPVFSRDSRHERATPTGAAIVSYIAARFGDMPVLRAEASGYGAGARVFGDDPNFLRVIIGTPEGAPPAVAGRDEVVALETNIDDMDPRLYPYIVDKLLKNGANDVWLAQVIMKKGRPGIVLHVLCQDRDEKRIAEIIFNETTTLGIRRMVVSRHILKRAMRAGVKTAHLPGGKRKRSFEYETARQKAERTGIPLKLII